MPGELWDDPIPPEPKRRRWPWIVGLLTIYVVVASAFFIGVIGHERPRYYVGDPIVDLCRSYDTWKLRVGPAAVPDPAPNLTKRCKEGP